MTFLHSLDEYGNSTLHEEGAHYAPDIMYEVTKLFTLNALLCLVSRPLLSATLIPAMHEIASMHQLGLTWRVPCTIKSSRSFG